MSGAGDPRFWTEDEWHARALKVAALLDGMSAADADKLLMLVGRMVAGSAVFRIDSPGFQELVRAAVCDGKGD